MLTSAAIADFIADREAAGRALRTIDFYQAQLAFLARAALELPTTPGPLREIIRARPGSHATKHALFRALRALYKFAEREELITAAENPLKKITAPPNPRKHQRTLDRPDVDQLLSRTTNERDRAIIITLLDTGIRAGELRSIRGRDLRQGWIHVQGKTGQREVPAHPETIDILKRLHKSNGRGPDEHVFITVYGNPLPKERLYKIVRAAIERATPDAHGKRGPHTLRHTFGRHFITAGGDLVSLQQILGHHDIKTTAIYVDLAVDELAEQHRIHANLAHSQQLKLAWIRGG